MNSVSTASSGAPSSAATKASSAASVATQLRSLASVTAVLSRGASAIACYYRGPSARKQPRAARVAGFLRDIAAPARTGRPAGVGISARARARGLRLDGRGQLHSALVGAAPAPL